MTIRCAVYARVSTDRQGDSLANQVEFAREYVRQLGEAYTLDESRIYKDADESGYYTRFLQRPAIQSALSDAKQRAFDVIVFKEISRISRDQAEHVEIVSRFTQCGVRVIAINDHLDSDRPETLDLLGIHSVMSEMESKRISSRVSSGKRSVARRGVWLGEPPIGYILNPQTRRLEEDLACSLIPKLIFELYTQERLGTLRIAQRLNAQRLYTRRGNLWSRVTVNRVLRNPAYVGDLVYGRRRNALKRVFDDDGYRKLRTKNAVPAADWVVVSDAHPALVDRSAFAAAQDLLAGRARQNPGRTQHPLTGLLICGHCAGGMVCQRQRRLDREYRYYCCSRAFRFGRSACPQPNLSAPVLEQAVWRLVCHRLQPYAFAHVQVRSATPARVASSRPSDRSVHRSSGDPPDRSVHRSSGDPSDGLSDRAGVNRSRLIADLQSAQLALRRLLEQTALPASTYQLLVAEYAASIRQLEDQLAATPATATPTAATPAVPTPPSVGEYLQELRAADLSQLPMLRKVLHSLIHHITVNDERIEEIVFLYTGI